MAWSCHGKGPYQEDYPVKIIYIHIVVFTFLFYRVALQMSFGARNGGKGGKRDTSI